MKETAGVWAILTIYITYYIPYVSLNHIAPLENTQEILLYRRLFDIPDLSIDFFANCLALMTTIKAQLGSLSFRLLRLGSL